MCSGVRGVGVAGGSGAGGGWRACEVTFGGEGSPQNGDLLGICTGIRDVGVIGGENEARVVTFGHGGGVRTARLPGLVHPPSPVLKSEGPFDKLRAGPGAPEGIQMPPLRDRGLYHAADAVREMYDMGDTPSCGVCGAIMVRNGSCYRCMSCGSASGCS